MKESLVIFVAAFLTFVGVAVAEDTIYVQVSASKIHAKPQMWSAAVASVKYGDPLTKLSAEQGWLKVKNSGGAQGFIHASAVTPKKVVFASKGGVTNTQAESSDIVLASKGFSPEVEKQFASSNPEANFRAVDEMEKLRVSEKELASFIQGGLLGKEG